MIAIRGATTIVCDSPEEIRAKVKELVNAITDKNRLKCEDIISIVFSSTQDIHSFYPAKAARECGYSSCALFSCEEPKINGSLELCIRVLVLAESNLKPQHVYLGGAAALRRDISSVYNVAIDGPAGSGKSTVSKLVAKKLDILCLDTGAMYRACALKCVESGVDVKDEKRVEKLIKNISLEIKYKRGAQITLLDGEDVSAKIREPQISMLASTVSALGCVREKMVELQRKIARENSCVLDGRDIGTNVLPDAKFKFYLTARSDVRAKRRQIENSANGFSRPFEEILKQIEARDKQDAERKIAPLKRARDAVEVDTSDMTIEEVTALILNKIREKF